MVNISENFAFRYETFNNRPFENHLFKNVTFYSCRFENVVFTNCKFINVFWDTCNFDEVYFFHNKIVNSNFGLSIFDDCKFMDNVYNDGLFTESFDVGGVYMRNQISYVKEFENDMVLDFMGNSKIDN